MDLMLLWNQGPVIVTHVGAAVLAFALGLFVLFRRKGGKAHRMSGRIWAGLMILVAGTSLFIHEIRMWGPFSPIHLLSLYVLIAVPYAVICARQGNIVRHQNFMKQNFFWGVVVAGAFTFLPNRLLAHVAGDGLLAMAMPVIWVAIPMVVYLVSRRLARPAVSA